METSPGQSSYQLSPPAGTRTDKIIQFENTGEADRVITLSCEDIKRDMCQYITFKEETFDLPLIKDEILRKSFTASLPKDIEAGEYKFNIIATDEEGRTRLITTTVSTGGEALLLETLSKISLKTSGGFPYWIIFIFLFMALIVGSTKLIPKETPVKFLLVMGISGFISLGVIYLI